MKNIGSKFEKFRDVDRLLKQNGYTLSRTKGGHSYYKHTTKDSISIPRGTKGMCAMMIRRLIKENDLRID